MKNRAFAILAALAVLVAAAVAVVARSAHASPQAVDTYNFVIVPEGRTSFVDNPTKAAKGKFDPRPGDSFSSRGRVLDATGLEVGRTSLYCTETVKEPLTFECSISLIINDGEMIVAGALNPLALPWSGAVVGGTGTYAGATGVVQVAAQGTQERWTVSVRRG